MPDTITYASVHLPPEPGGDCTVFLYDTKDGERLGVQVIPERNLSLELAGYTVETTEANRSLPRSATRRRMFPYVDYRPINLAERRALAGM